MGVQFTPKEPKPDLEARIKALETENKSLAARNQALTESTQMLEDCLVEMAGVVYG